MKVSDLGTEHIGSMVRFTGGDYNLSDRYEFEAVLRDVKLIVTIETEIVIDLSGGSSEVEINKSYLARLGLVNTRSRLVGTQSWKEYNATWETLPLDSDVEIIEEG